jgi:actin-like ATPase involved in cell morphogenesis
MAYSLGIDLGTTSSAAATARDGRIEIVQLGDEEATMPSIVVLRARVEVLVGDAAARQSLSEPTRTASDFKRRLGDPTPIILGGNPYGAESLLAHLLKAIVAKVSEQSGGPPDAIALTHPASYGAHKIELLQQAIRQADVGKVSLLTDAEAAAAHDAQQEGVPVGAVIAVYDFGGGTLDATVLRRTDTGFVQLGRPETMERFGGIDFDEALFTSVMAQVRLAGITVDPKDPATLAALARLRDECKRAKEALSSDTETTIQVVLPGFQTELPLTREDFEWLIRPRITETIDALRRAVESAGLGFEGVDRVLLVGGSSRIPLVAEMVREATGRPIAVDAAPKLSVALGAAFVAEQRRLAASTDTAAVATAAAVAGTGTILAMEAAAAMDAAEADETGAAESAGEAAGGVPPGEPGGPDGTGTFPPTEVTPVVVTSGSAVATAGVRQTGRRRMIAALAAIGGIALLLVLGIAASGMLSGATPSSPSPSVAQVSAAPSGSPSLAPSASPTPIPSSDAVPTASALASPTSTPAGQQVRITGILVSDGRYVVDYEVFGYEPALPGRHMHFFFDTVSVADAGVPGTGPWFLYAGPMPFTGYKVSDRPSAATRMCVLVANADHTVVPDTGNCVDLP